MQTAGSNQQKTAQNGGVTILKNQFTPTGNMTLVLASDGTGNQNNAKVIIFPGYVPDNSAIGGKMPDGTHITLTAPDLTSTNGFLLDYLKSVKMHVTSLTITTTDLANFSGGNMLTIGKVSPDGRSSQNTDIMLNKYKVQAGQNISDTMTIDDVDFTTGGNFFMVVKKLALSSNMTFYFEISGTNDNAVIS